MFRDIIRQMKSKNIVLICIDCLRSDLFFENDGHTPFIDHIIANETTYQNLHTSANTTTPAVASLMTGTYSEKNGVHSLRESKLNKSTDTLAEILSKYGYDTYANVTGPLSANTGLNRGFDSYHHRSESTDIDEDVLDEFADWMKSTEDPFFAYFHLWELHAPVEVSEQYDDPSYGRCAYERKLSELDQKLKRLIEHVKREDCVILITGDHGEAFSWRGTAIQFTLSRIRGSLRFDNGFDTRNAERAVNRFLSKFSIDIHDHPIENGHGETVGDFVTNVPLAIIDDNLPGNTFDQQCRQIDIHPTLINMVTPFEMEGIHGVDLQPPTDFNSRPAYIRSCGITLGGRENWARAVRAGGYKLIRYPNREWKDELYNLTTDPTETRVENNKKIINKLESYFPASDMEVKERRKLDNEEQLKSLGYM
jgi:arylsulfatase A-like enzyme